MSEEPNITPAARRQKIETRFMASCQTWAGKIAAWSVRAGELRAERQQLDKELQNTMLTTAGELVTIGMDAVDVEKHLEALMEKAFAQ